MKKSKINLAVSLTWRVEELNVYLDILKKNFKHDTNVFLFCNLNDDSLRKIQESINFKNVDEFIRLPDEKCHKNNTDKQDCKRRQPLDFFCNILGFINSREIDKFIYTECDVFPLDEKKYFKYYKSVNENTSFLRKCDITNAKVPFGYLSPSPMYMSKKFSHKLLSNLVSNREMYLRNGFAFEGMLSHAALTLEDDFSIFSSHFRSNHIVDKNIEPVSYTTHQHNVFNLKHALQKFSLTNGDYINHVLTNNKINRVWDNEEIINDGIILSEM